MTTLGPAPVSPVSSRDQIRPGGLDVAQLRRLYVNLAAVEYGAEILEVSDEFFAPAPRMLSSSEPVFEPDRYDDHGKWMDGWETRRRRRGGHDSCVIRLACEGVIEAIVVDTRHFTGNFAPAFRLEGSAGQARDWVPLTGVEPLEGDRQAIFEPQLKQRFSHVRLSIYPDGGVARLRLYGRPQRDWAQVSRRYEAGRLEMSSLRCGGRVLAWSDSHFGPPEALLRPGKGRNMGDGWETRRRREPGNDWLLIGLEHPALLSDFEVDTAFFKGNYPDRVSVQGEFSALTGLTSLAPLIAESQFWPSLLEPQSLAADQLHSFPNPNPEKKVNCLRLNIFPDGGVSRFRAFGKPVL